MATSRKHRVRAALVTGFEPFGAYPHNPSGEIAHRLDDTKVAGVRVVGRILPVDLGRIDGAIERILHEIDPICVIALGLAVGEPVIRLERVALNLAAFEIPDNAGRLIDDHTLEPGAVAALWARLDLQHIQKVLIAKGIPARLSSTAGTYLCNAAMYRFLRATPTHIPCGFIHLPLMPAQVAAKLARGRDVELTRLASMARATMQRAVVTALAVTLARRRRERPARA